MNHQRRGSDLGTSSSSFDYLYQAIALIEAKNNSGGGQQSTSVASTSASSQSQSSHDSMMTSSSDYSNALAAAAANFNTRRILGTLFHHFYKSRIK